MWLVDRMARFGSQHTAAGAGATRVGWHAPRVSQDHGRERDSRVFVIRCRATRRKRAAGRKRRRHVSDLAAELTDSAFHMHKTGRGAPGWRPHVGHAMAVYTDQEVVAESMIVVVSHHLALYRAALMSRGQTRRGSNTGESLVVTPSHSTSTARIMHQAPPKRPADSRRHAPPRREA